ncbi:unnamed protein product [Prunus armeniaca]
MPGPIIVPSPMKSCIPLLCLCSSGPVSLELEKSLTYGLSIVELERADLTAAEQKQVDQVLALLSTERAANILLASEGVSGSVGRFTRLAC